MDLIMQGPGGAPQNLQPPAVAIAVGGALIGATLVELGAGERGNSASSRS
jgi:hypothetical protein